VTVVVVPGAVAVTVIVTVLLAVVGTFHGVATARTERASSVYTAGTKLRGNILIAKCGRLTCSPAVRSRLYTPARQVDRSIQASFCQWSDTQGDTTVRPDTRLSESRASC
jgi:hypothetical protein